MNLPLTFNLNCNEPMNNRFHGVYDNVLALTAGLCESKMSFILLWDEELHEAHHHIHGLKGFRSTDFATYKERFGKLNSPFFYAPNSKYHTLFQDLYFFKLYEEFAKVLIVPVLDAGKKCCGLLGILHPENPASIERNKHQLTQMGLHVGKLRTDKIKSIKDNKPKPTLLQSLNQLPGAHYEFTISAQGQLGFPSVSKELINIHPHFWDIDHLSSPEAIFSKLHQMEFQEFRNFLLEKQENKAIELSYALKSESGCTKYYMLRINTYLHKSGKIVCFGTIRDISLQKSYEAVLEQIIFDISHVMRRPVATMQGLTTLIELDQMNKETVREVAYKLQLVSNEMDAFIKQLYANYQQRWEELEEEAK